jgi:hypothetical protein
MGIPHLLYDGPKNQQLLILQGPIKIVIPYTQNDYMIINLKIMIYMIYICLHREHETIIILKITWDFNLL